MTTDHRTPPFSDEQVMAYVDGELDASMARRLQAALADDAALARRVEAERALRARLGRALAAELDEPVPARLRALLPEAGSGPGHAATGDATRATPAAAPAPVADLAAARAAKAARLEAPAARAPVPPMARWALAACLVGGVALGWFGRPAVDGFADVGPAEIVARGALADALEHQPGDDARGPVRVPLTVRSADGRYCRAFIGPEGAGLACRGERGWRVRVLTPVPPTAAGTGLRLAGAALPPSVLEAVDEVAAAPSLDAQAERAAMAARWAR